MNPPVVHLQQAVAARGQTAIMRGHHQSHALGGDNLQQQIEDRAARLFIERAGRLVGQQNLWPVHQRAAERGALALAAGELLDAMAEAMREAGALGKLMQARLRGAAIDARGHRGNKAVLFQRQIGNEVVELKDEAHLVAQKAQQIAMAIDLDAIDRDASAVGRIEAAEQMQQRALAAARWPAERDRLALG